MVIVSACVCDLKGVDSKQSYFRTRFPHATQVFDSAIGHLVLDHNEAIIEVGLPSDCGGGRLVE